MKPLSEWTDTELREVILGTDIDPHGYIAELLRRERADLMRVLAYAVARFTDPQSCATDPAARVLRDEAGKLGVAWPRGCIRGKRCDPMEFRSNLVEVKDRLRRWMARPT